MDDQELQAKIGGVVIAGLFVLGFIIYLAQQLFQFFLVLTSISLLVFVIIGIRDLFFREEYEDVWCVYPFIAMAGFGIISLLMGFVGYGIGGTQIGQAATGFYSQTTIAEQQLSDSLNQAYNKVIETSCQSLSVENCNLLKSYAKTAKDLQDLQDYADKLEGVSNLVQKATT